MKIAILPIVLGCLCSAACQNRNAQPPFFEKDAKTRASLLGAMDVEAIYKLYKYEADLTPATAETAPALGAKGEESFNVMIADLDRRDGLIRPADYLPVLRAQCELSDFCVCNSAEKLDRLNRAVSQVRGGAEPAPSAHLKTLCDGNPAAGNEAGR